MDNERIMKASSGIVDKVQSVVKDGESLHDLAKKCINFDWTDDEKLVLMVYALGKIEDTAARLWAGDERTLQ
jgi:hypothetical protein